MGRRAHAKSMARLFLFLIHHKHYCGVLIKYFTRTTAPGVDDE